MVGCWAFGCSNRPEHKKLMHRFPMDGRRRKLWIQNIRRTDLHPNCNSRLCEDHFKEDQYEIVTVSGQRKLKRSAVPTVFNQQPPSPNRQNPPLPKNGKSSAVTDIETALHPATLAVCHDHTYKINTAKSERTVETEDISTQERITRSTSEDKRTRVTKYKAMACHDLPELSSKVPFHIDHQYLTSTSDGSNKLESPRGDDNENGPASDSNELQYLCPNNNEFEPTCDGNEVEYVCGDNKELELCCNENIKIEHVWGDKNKLGCGCDGNIKTEHVWGDNNQIEEANTIARLRDRVISLKYHLRKVRNGNILLKQMLGELGKMWGPDQFKVLGRRCTGGLPWSADTISKARNVYLACGSTNYDEVRTLVRLPAARTLKMHFSRKNCGNA